MNQQQPTPLRPAMAKLVEVCTIFAVHRQTAAKHIRIIGTDDNGSQPLEGRKTGIWFVAWDSIARLLCQDVNSVHRLAGVPAQRRLVLSLCEAAQVLPISAESIVTLMNGEKTPIEIHGFKFGGDWKIPMAEIARWSKTPIEEVIAIADYFDRLKPPDVA